MAFPLRLSVLGVAYSMCLRVQQKEVLIGFRELGLTSGFHCKVERPVLCILIPVKETWTLFLMLFKRGVASASVSPSEGGVACGTANPSWRHAT